MESTDYASNLLDAEYQQRLIERVVAIVRSASNLGVRTVMNGTTAASYERLGKDRNVADVLKVLHELVRETALRLQFGEDMTADGKAKLWLLHNDMLAELRITTDMAIAFAQNGVPLKVSIQIQDTAEQTRRLVA